MALTAPLTQVGTTMHISANAPATFDQSGCEALSYTKIGGVVTIPEIGDSSEDGTVTSLEEGRVLHFNGVKDFAPFTVELIYDAADTGQDIVRTNKNGTTECTIKIVDADSTDTYIVGVVGPVMSTERSPSTHKGQTFEFRPISGEVVVE